MRTLLAVIEITLIALSVITLLAAAALTSIPVAVTGCIIGAIGMAFLVAVFLVSPAKSSRSAR